MKQLRLFAYFAWNSRHYRGQYPGGFRTFWAAWRRFAELEGER